MPGSRGPGSAANSSDMAGSWATNLYARSREESMSQRLRQLFKRQEKSLSTFYDHLAESCIRRSQYVGLQNVAIGAIRGSEARGRTADFDSDFRPLQDRTSDRWRSVAMAWFKGTRLPPVQLVKVGEYYFVRDGHHRISVARATEQFEVQSEVTVLDVAESCAVDLEAMRQKMQR
jgi:hypothetical protein